MPTNLKPETNTYLKDAGSSLEDIDSSLIRVILAESVLSEVALIRMGILDMPRILMTTVRTFDQLLQSIVQEQPQLVLLGNIDVVNYFLICQECQKISPGISIALLSKQAIINDSFRQMVQSYGVIDVVCSSDFDKLTQLFEALESNQPLTIDSVTQSSRTGKMMLANLEEIVTVSNNYFGPLAQGNYWRKSHNSLVDQFPFLQKWSADHFGKVTCDTSILNQKLTVQDIQCLQRWVGLFIEECERIIVGYREILEKSDLSPAAQELLAKLP
jgi:uncharacterized membrane protein